jgi:TetR/AcrR family transcriptional regulator, transcriptional repressor for nem operon
VEVVLSVEGTSRERARPAQPRQLTARGAATRDRIVNAAADLMYTQGVERTSLDDVIEVSGTGKSQLYHYFSDKSELVEQVVRFQVGQVMKQQTPLLENLRSMRGLERWRDMVVANMGAYGCPLGSLSSELADHSEPVRQEVQAGFSAWESQLRAGLERMQESGELDAKASPADFATGLLAAVQGGYLLSQARQDPASMRISLDMAVDHIRSYVRASPARGSRPKAGRPRVSRAETAGS